VRIHYVQAAIHLGLVEPTLPDKPKSPLQKYQLTAAGIALQQQLK
jgi:ATP-dependent DNA helicase RecG